jgi:CheY-like chemotaxis protein
VARVLVVEDEAPIRCLLQQALGEDGHEVDVATDSLNALDRLRSGRPDLIVLDLFMPRMDGWEFLTVTHSSPDWRDVPVLVVTAADRLPSDRRIRAVLKKPFDLSLLSTTVHSLLDKPPAELVS